jgi:hypothetical protein
MKKLTLKVPKRPGIRELDANGQKQVVGGQGVGGPCCNPHGPPIGPGPIG